MRKLQKPTFRDRCAALLHSKKFIEGSKNALIAVLLVTASLLLVRTGVFDLRASGSSGAKGGSRSVQQQTGAAASSKLAVSGPYVIAVTNSSGSHCGLMYDGTELRQAYDRLSAYLSEAFGSAGETKQVSRDEWLAALKKQGVYFDFAYPQPLSLLASALGTNMTSSASGHSAARFCIAVDAASVSLYYCRAEDGEYYRCDTAISGSALEAKLRDWSPNGAKFLFETDYVFDQVDGCFLIEEGQAALHSASAQNPLNTDYSPSALAEVFNMNSYMASHYTESDGTEVYVDGGSILRIYSGGSVSYKSSDSAAGGTGIDAALSAASAAAAATVGKSCGTAAVTLRYVNYDTRAGSYTVRYGYDLGGIPVSLGDAEAAEFTVTGGVVTAAELKFREYTYSGEEDSPLPAVQAMAVVQASGGGMPLLCYVDRGGTVAAGWTIEK